MRSFGLFVALFSEYLEADVLGAWPWWIDSEGLVASLYSR